MSGKNVTLWIVLVAVSFAILYLAEGCSAQRALLLASIIGIVKVGCVTAHDRAWSYWSEVAARS